MAQDDAAGVDDPDVELGHEREDPPQLVCPSDTDVAR